MSLPYTSRAIDQLIQNAQEMLTKEQEALWRVKQLANDLRGDQNWVPCGVLETEHDLLLFNQGVPGTTAPPSVVGSVPDTTENVDFADEAGQAQLMVKTESGPQNAGIGSKAEAAEKGQNESGAPSTTDMQHEDASVVADPAEDTNTEEQSVPQEGADTAMAVDAPTATQPPPTTDGDQPTNTTAQDDDAAAAHQMTTRSAAARDPHPTSPDLLTTPSSPQIHPFFIPPASALPSKTHGLPFSEVDDTRRLLYAYCQRQEEVCRGVTRLYHGLLRAKRLKDTVWEWCNAEGHVGEMSDGEDWVDEAAWGLAEGELKKGEDEIEEGEADVVVGGRTGVAAGGGKKTRGRRGAGN